MMANKIMVKIFYGIFLPFCYRSHMLSRMYDDGVLQQDYDVLKFGVQALQ
jgi:hypothetical protein